MLLFATYLVLVIALPVLVSAAIGYQALPRGRTCPNCANETLPVVAPAIQLLKRMYPQLSLERRWCTTCMWDGYARAPARVGAAALSVSSGIATRQTQPLRTLDLGGRSWSVLLEYWRERGRCYGRLLFVGPSGKLWSDPLAAFHGSSQHDVLGQALALSDRLLAYRLREVISG